MIAYACLFTAITIAFTTEDVGRASIFLGTGLGTQGLTLKEKSI